MTVPQQVAHFLQTHRPLPYCDSCIRRALKLKQPQEVQQATAGGAASGGFIRRTGTCSVCGKNSTVTHAENSFDSGPVIVHLRAESLYEAVLRGLNRLADVGWESGTAETIKQVEVEIYQEPTRQVVDVPKLLKGINQNAISPTQETLKGKFRKLPGNRESPSNSRPRAFR